MSTRDLSFTPAPAGPGRLREIAAAALRASSRVLTIAARRLRRPDSRRAVAEPVFEFHAEAGAPEGALYVDGRLVGHVPGIDRL